MTRTLFPFLLVLSPLFAQPGKTEYAFTGVTSQPPWIAHYVNAKASKATISFDGAVETPVGKGAMKVSVTQMSLTTNGSDSQVWVVHPKSLVGGKKYRLSVLLKGSAANKVSLQFIKNGSPYSPCTKPSGVSIPIGTEWKTETVEIEGVDLGEGATLRLPDFFFGALPTGYQFWVAKITLQE